MNFSRQKNYHYQYLIENLLFTIKDCEKKKLKPHAYALFLTKEKLSKVKIENLFLFKLSHDTRKNKITFNAQVVIETNAFQKILKPFNEKSLPIWVLPKHKQLTVNIVGAGPAGLFAAYILSLGGAKVNIIDRGKAVKERNKDISAHYKKGLLNENSNVCYGEGGAGTYSDGKLYTRANKPMVRDFYKYLIHFGAKEDILINHRPHIGTDKLVNILISLRHFLESNGVNYLFNQKVDTLNINNQNCNSVSTREGLQIEGQEFIFATGHSSDDIWRLFQKHNIQMQFQDFSVGFRVEHLQQSINKIRYQEYSDHPYLSAADYKLVAHSKTLRPDGQPYSTHSFCMCPGGVVVSSSTEQDELCINGMSHSSRSGQFANSAIVTNVTAQDFNSESLFQGVDFQKTIGKRAYLLGGGNYTAPASSLIEFLENKKQPNQLNTHTSYRRKLNQVSLQNMYPKKIIQRIQQGIQSFEKKMPGYINPEAKIIGVETRTSSPIRVLRNKENYSSFGVNNIYPCGEGMGYAGGISSAALDGIKIAKQILIKHGAQPIEH